MHVAFRNMRNMCTVHTTSPLDSSNKGGSWVWKASMVQCSSLPCLDTLDWFLINTNFCGHTIECGSVYNIHLMYGPKVNSCDQVSTKFWPSINWVSTEYQLSSSSVGQDGDQVLIEMLIECRSRLSIDTWLQMPLYCSTYSTIYKGRRRLHGGKSALGEIVNLANAWRIVFHDCIHNLYV